MHPLISYDSVYTINAPDQTPSELNGIITTLHKQKKFRLANLVDIKVSSSLSSIAGFSTIARTNGHWESNDSLNNYIIYNFRDSLLYLKSLSIKCNIKGNRDFPSAFVVSGSNDDVIWTEIAKTDDKTYFTDFSQIVNFPVTPGYFSSIKLVNTGPNEQGTKYFCIEEIEFFGKFIKRMRRITNIRCIRTSNAFLLMQLMTIITCRSRT